MFFRRDTPQVHTFASRMENLRAAGFTVTPRAAAVRVTREACAIDLKDEAGEARAMGAAGIVMGDEIGALIDGGYQKFFRTPSGRQQPGLASELKALHDFEEDLKEALGQESYYNESLGTVSTYYLYDRVKDRDQGVPKRVWET